MTDAARTSHVIERLGHQGDGIARGPIFVPRTLPGEEVSGITDGQALLDVRIESPSDARVKPLCRHYKSCGGCQLQHASDEFVADWKVGFLRAALQAQGLQADFRTVHTSPAQSRRRASFAARRTKKGATVGFHGRASGTIVEIPDCQLLVPQLREAVDMVAQLAVTGASRKTPLSVMVTHSPVGLDVAVNGGKSLDGQLRLALAQIVGRFSLSRLTWEDEPVAMEQPPIQRFGNAEVCPPPGAFLQATQDGEAVLVQSVREIVSGAKRIVDLFAGCGTFTLPLSEDAEVHAIEGEAEMIAALDKGWRAAVGLKKVTSETRDLFRNPMIAEDFKEFGKHTEAVVIDPPRAGAEAQVAQLALAKVPTIAYVSCNPVTFARDAKTLVDAGYDLNWVQAVDQFRWSPHTELVASFTYP